MRLALAVPASLLVQGLDPAVEFFPWVLIVSVISLVFVSYLISRLLVRPFSGLIRRVLLRAIEREAELRAR